MDALDDIHGKRRAQGAASRVAAGRLVRLYLTQVGTGAHPQPKQRAVAGAVGRTVSRTHVHDAFREFGELISRWVPGEASWTAGELRASADRLLDELCPAAHQQAAHELVRRRVDAAATSPGPGPVVATGDRYGAVHGEAALTAALIAATGADRQAVLGGLPALDVQWDGGGALSAYLRDEWRRRVTIWGWWLAAQEHEYTAAPDDTWTDLSAVVDDLRLLAPVSPQEAPDDWPGGWVLRRDGRDVLGPGARARLAHPPPGPSLGHRADRISIDRGRVGAVCQRGGRHDCAGPPPLGHPRAVVPNWAPEAASPTRSPAGPSTGPHNADDVCPGSICWWPDIKAVARRHRPFCRP